MSGHVDMGEVIITRKSCKTFENTVKSKTFVSGSYIWHSCCSAFEFFL